MAKMKFHKDHPELDTNLDHLKISTNSRLSKLKKKHNFYKKGLIISSIVNIILILLIVFL